MSDSLNQTILDHDPVFEPSANDNAGFLWEVSSGQIDHSPYFEAVFPVDTMPSARVSAREEILHCPVSEATPETPPVRLREIPPLQAAAKRAFDVVASLLALILLSPTWLTITVILALQDGPILFSQERIGKNGRMFRCFKFRTMRVGADAMLAKVLANDADKRAEWDAQQKLADDPRITAIGKILRLTSLDELPQLLNVLKGDMSIVGPRPIVRNEIAKYRGYYPYLLSVKPGLTGMWQVNGRGSTTYNRRVALDVAYVNNFSLALDAKIIALTLPALIRTDEVS